MNIIPTCPAGLSKSFSFVVIVSLILLSFSPTTSADGSYRFSKATQYSHYNNSHKINKHDRHQYSHRSWKSGVRKNVRQLHKYEYGNRYGYRFYNKRHHNFSQGYGNQFVNNCSIERLKSCDIYGNPIVVRRKVCYDIYGNPYVARSSTRAITRRYNNY